MNGAVARRHARRVTISVLVIAVLAACSRAGGEVSPTPSLSLPPTSPAPAVTIDADGRALPGFVTVSEELPEAQPGPAELLPQTGPGWSLQTYRPQVEPVTEFDGITPGTAATVQVVYLVAPEGQRYQLLELDPAVPVVIDSWSAGDVFAYVHQCEPLECDPAAPTMRLNLLTGALTRVPDVADDMNVGATLANSVRWWQNGVDTSAIEIDGGLRPYTTAWTAVSVSPDGTYVAVQRTDEPSAFTSAGLAIVNAETGALTDLASLWPEPLTCEPFRWRADGALDVSCYDPIRDVERVFAVAPGAREMRENAAATATPPAEGAWVEPDFFVAEGVWAGPYSADVSARLAPEVTAIGLARNAGFEQLVVPDAGVGFAEIVAAGDGWVFVAATQTNNPVLTTAWRFDVLEEQWTELGPLPPSGPTRGLLATQGSPASGMTSWAIAP